MAKTNKKIKKKKKKGKTKFIATMRKQGGVSDEGSEEGCVWVTASNEMLNNCTLCAAATIRKQNKK